MEGLNTNTFMQIGAGVAGYLIPGVLNTAFDNIEMLRKVDSFFTSDGVRKRKALVSVIGGIGGAWAIGALGNFKKETKFALLVGATIRALRDTLNLLPATWTKTPDFMGLSGLGDYEMWDPVMSGWPDPAYTLGTWDPAYTLGAVDPAYTLNAHGVDPAYTLGNVDPAYSVPDNGVGQVYESWLPTMGNAMSSMANPFGTMF